MVPYDWKKGGISPIFKKGSKNIAGNYRPISLTCVLCKLMESLLRDHVLNHLMVNPLLSKKQDGFISGRSTVTQLLKYFYKCAQSVATGKVVDAIYLDFEKAFDTMPHQRLTRFSFYKHHLYKHRETQIWPKIKHHLSTILSLT